MERTLLSVEEHESGWQVVLAGETLQLAGDKRVAIDTASRFARNRHDVTGEPTGVAAPLCNGEVVVVVRCG